MARKSIADLESLNKELQAQIEALHIEVSMLSTELKNTEATVSVLSKENGDKDKIISLAFKKQEVDSLELRQKLDQISELHITIRTLLSMFM